jgi:uncharacterized repeat protein (TIGR01451 family)
VTSGVATITAGTMSTTITVPVLGDVAFETDENFFVDLSGASNAVIADNQAVGTILNDDAPTANLAVTKTASTTTFTPGQQVTYTITVTNFGPEPATAITVTDVLPAGASFVSVAGATCAGTTTVTCTIPALAANASTVITLVVTANGSAPIANTASATAAAPADATPANNAATVTINPAIVSPAAIPTASEWGLLLLALALACVALKRA